MVLKNFGSCQMFNAAIILIYIVLSAGFPVVRAKGPHPFPSRTRKLSPSAPMLLGPEPWESRPVPGTLYLKPLKEDLVWSFFVTQKETGVSGEYLLCR